MGCCLDDLFYFIILSVVSNSRSLSFLIVGVDELNRAANRPVTEEAKTTISWSFYLIYHYWL